MPSSDQVEPRAANEIEVAEDIRFQERIWRLEGYGRWIFAALVAAALAGLFGSGPLSTGKATDPDGLVTVDYERLLRQMTPTRLRVTVAAEATRSGEITLHLGAALLEAVTIRRIVPEPDRSVVTPEGASFTFRWDRSGSGGIVTFDLTSEGPGLIEAAAGIAGRAPARFWQLAYP